MIVYLIRHSMTEGNLKKRYIGGRTDEPLCPDGRAFIQDRHYPEVDAVYVSPMIRCLETASIIYPKKEYHFEPGLQECDFGDFENKNYQELSGLPAYQEWVDSGGTISFPGGEHPDAFRKRSVEAFEKVIRECKEEGYERVALVVHGGTIMSIMEIYARPHGGYYDFQIRNGEGYELELDDVCAGGGRIYSGFDFGGSDVAVSSGETDRTSDYMDRKNYQKLHFEQ